jgi:hypothetical protein
MNLKYLDMKNSTRKFFLLFLTVLSFSFSRASGDWPKLINTANGTQIKVYEPEPESFKGNTLMFRSAISVLENGSNEPVFGAFWATAKVETDRDNRLSGFQPSKARIRSTISMMRLKPVSRKLPDLSHLMRLWLH